MNYFSNIRLVNFNYEDYWTVREVEIRKELRDREKIFFNWITPGSRVLDVAAGNSLLPRALKEKKNCDITICDISQKVVEKQRGQGINAHVVDLSSDEFKLDKDYDYIVLSEILEHLPLPEKIIQKVTPYTKFLIISVPNSAFYRFRLQLLGGRFLRQWAAHPSEHLRFWSHKDFLEWLNVLKLEVLETKASNGLDIGSLKLYNLLPNLLGHQMTYLCRKKENLEFRI